MKDKNALKFIFENTRPYLGYILLIALEGAVLSVCGVLLALTSRNLINIATGQLQGDIWNPCIRIAIIICIQALCKMLGGLLRTAVSGKLSIRIKNSLFAKLMGKDYSEITSYHSGEILNRFTGDVEHVITLVVSAFPNTVALVTKFIAASVVLFALDAKLALIAVVVGIIVVFGNRIYSRRFKALHKEVQASEGKTKSLLQESFANIIVIKSFVMGLPVVRRLNALMQDNYRLKMKRGTVSAVSGTAVSFFFSAGYYITLGWGAYNILNGNMDYGTLLALIQLIAQLRTPVSGMSGLVPQYFSAIASAERLIELRDMTEEEGKDTELDVKATYDLTESIELSGISFAYDNENIIDDSGFSIKKGSITALVGKSGQGKSTVFRLLLGLFKPQQGSMVFRCKERDVEINAGTRKMFAFVPQGNMMLSGTVRENLVWGMESVTEEDIINAAKVADIYDFIVSLPKGFDTVIGERGLGMSEGQVQRLSIARAVLCDAPVLLLDECTSALDEQTEKQVLTNIKALKSKTVLIITHGKAALSICDSTVTLKDGKFYI